MQKRWAKAYALEYDIRGLSAERNALNRGGPGAGAGGGGGGQIDRINQQIQQQRGQLDRIMNNLARLGQQTDRNQDILRRKGRWVGTSCSDMRQYAQSHVLLLCYKPMKPVVHRLVPLGLRHKKNETNFNPGDTPLLLSMSCAAFTSYPGRPAIRVW